VTPPLFSFRARHKVSPIRDIWRTPDSRRQLPFDLALRAPLPYPLFFSLFSYPSPAGRRIIDLGLRWRDLD